MHLQNSFSSARYVRLLWASDMYCTQSSHMSSSYGFPDMEKWVTSHLICSYCFYKSVC